MKQHKPFLLRLNPALYDSLESWAQQELRSVNGQIEFLLLQAVRQRQRGTTTPNETADLPIFVSCQKTGNAFQSGIGFSLSCLQVEQGNEELIWRMKEHKRSDRRISEARFPVSGFGVSHRFFAGKTTLKHRWLAPQPLTESKSGLFVQGAWPGQTIERCVRPPFPRIHSGEI